MKGDARRWQRARRYEDLLYQPPVVEDFSRKRKWNPKVAVTD